MIFKAYAKSAAPQQQLFRRRERERGAKSRGQWRLAFGCPESDSRRFMRPRRRRRRPTSSSSPSLSSFPPVSSCSLVPRLQPSRSRSLRPAATRSAFSRQESRGTKSTRRLIENRRNPSRNSISLQPPFDPRIQSKRMLSGSREYVRKFEYPSIREGSTDSSLPFTLPAIRGETLRGGDPGKTRNEAQTNCGAAGGIKGPPRRDAVTLKRSFVRDSLLRVLHRVTHFTLNLAVSTCTSRFAYLHDQLVIRFYSLLQVPHRPRS